MKLDLTIKDVTLEQAKDIMAKISGDSVVTISGSQPASSNITPSIPAAPITPVNPVTPQVEFDSEGLPWDERIHSSSRKKNTNGTWARRRNVDENTYNSVSAQLRGAAAPAPAAQPAAPITPAMAPALANAPQGHFVPSAPVVSAPAVATSGYVQPATPPFLESMNQPPAAAPAPQAAPVHTAPTPRTINDLFHKIQQICQADPANGGTYVNSLNARLSHAFQFKVNAINDIANYPQMIDYAFQLIAEDGR